RARPRDELDRNRRRLVSFLVDEPHDPRTVRTREIRPAHARSVEGDIETMTVARLFERPLEQRASLLDGEAIVVRVLDDVGPTEVPRLERGGDGEDGVELAHLN